MNLVLLTGYLGSDPELQYTQSGNPVASVSIAVTKKWKSKDTNEVQEKTTWIRLVMWNSLAENAGKNLQKGSHILVNGEIQSRSWEDNDGVMRYTTEVLVTRFEFLDRKNPDNKKPIEKAPPPSDDDTPF